MDKHTKAIIATLFVPSFMLGTDFTGAMMLAVPIEHEYSVDITTTQWVLNSYALTFAMGLVAGGRLGDMFGRRRFLLIGLAVFFLASLVCTLAPSVAWLIGARAVQGIGAAIIWPASLALAATSVKEDERGQVIGLILGAVALGNVVAPFIAGLLGGLGAWRGFFLVNVILAVVSAYFVWRVLAKETPERVEERIDLAGMLVLSLAVFGLLFALDLGADWGWGSLPLIGLLLGAALLFAAFPLVERHVADPMVPPSMMGNRHLVMALALNGLVAPALFGLFLYIPQYLHKVLGWSVLWASIGTLPLLVALAVVNVQTGRFYNSQGPRRLLSAGYLLAVLGCLWVILMPASWGYGGTIPPMLLVGIGSGLALGPAGTAAVSAAEPKRAGLAGGLSFMFHLGLGAIGIAGATALIFAASLAALKQGLAGLGVTLSGPEQLTLNAGAVKAEAAQEVLAKFSPEVAEKITATAAEAFAAGFQQAYWLLLAFTALGLILALSLDEKKLGRLGDGED